MFEYLQDESIRNLIENTIIAFLVLNAFYDSYKINRAEAAIDRLKNAVIKLQGRLAKGKL